MLPNSLELLSCRIFHCSFSISLIQLVISLEVLDLMNIGLLWNVLSSSFSHIVLKWTNILISIQKNVLSLAMHRIMTEFSLVLLFVFKPAFSKSTFLAIYKNTFKHLSIYMMLFTIAVWYAINSSTFKESFIRQLNLEIDFLDLLLNFLLIHFLLSILAFCFLWINLRCNFLIRIT